MISKFHAIIFKYHQFLFQLNHLFYTMYVIVRSLGRRRTDIFDVDISTLHVSKQTVGETTRRRNERNSSIWLCVLFVENRINLLLLLLSFLSVSSVGTLKCCLSCHSGFLVWCDLSCSGQINATGFMSSFDVFWTDKGSLIAEMLSFRVSLQECLSVLLTLAALLNGLVSSQLGMFLIIISF